MGISTKHQLIGKAVNYGEGFEESGIIVKVVSAGYDSEYPSGELHVDDGQGPYALRVVDPDHAELNTKE